MSNRWMARFGFSTNEPPRVLRRRRRARRPDAVEPSAPQIDGGLVVTQTGGSGKSGIYMVLPQYQFIANGMYQGAGASTSARTGCSGRASRSRIFRSTCATGDPSRQQQDRARVGRRRRLPSAGRELARRAPREGVQDPGARTCCSISTSSTSATRRPCSAASTDLRLTGADRLQQGAGDHEPAHPPPRRALQLLRQARGQRGQTLLHWNPGVAHAAPGFFLACQRPTLTAVTCLCLAPTPCRSHLSFP